MDNVQRAALKEWANNVTLNLNNLMDYFRPEAFCVDDIRVLSTTADDYGRIHIFSGVYNLAEAVGVDVVVTDRNTLPGDPYKYRHSVTYHGIEFYEIRETDTRVASREEIE